MELVPDGVTITTGANRKTTIDLENILHVCSSGRGRGRVADGASYDCNTDCAIFHDYRLLIATTYNSKT